LVYACREDNLCGGWGDRQKGIVSTFLLALLTNRTFVIDISKPCGLENFLNLETSKYNWLLCKNFTDLLKRNNKSFISRVSPQTVLESVFNYNAEILEKQVIEINMNSYIMPSLKQNMKIITYSWVWELPNDEIIRMVLHTLFTQGNRLSQELNQFSLEHFQGKHVVCSHIRVGKNPSNPHDSSLPRGGPNITTVLNFLTKYTDPTKYVIYIATDSDEVKVNSSVLLNNSVFLNKTIVHVDRLGVFKNTADGCEGFYTVLFEQYLLSSCDTLILTRSNFGAISAYLRGSSEHLFLFDKRTNSIITTNLTGIQDVYKFV
jgi:hypothetical protein